MRQKYKIGKNPWGWFLSIPGWWGGYDVIEELPSHEAAVTLMERHANNRLYLDRP